MEQLNNVVTNLKNYERVELMQNAFIRIGLANEVILVCKN